MDDLQNKIEQLLNDPAALQQLKNLGAMMGLDVPQPPPAAPEPEPPSAQSGFNPSGIMGSSELLAVITRVMPLLQKLNSEDETTRLLNALHPFLSEDRRARLEQAKRMIQLFKILPLLKNSGIL